MDAREYAEGWRARARRRERERAVRLAELRRRLPGVVALLAREFGATRIVLFGSVARGEISDRSDIDLLVEGIPEDRFLAACAAADRAMGDVPVDLVPVRWVRPEVRARIDSEGIVQHG